MLSEGPGGAISKKVLWSSKNRPKDLHPVSPTRRDPCLGPQLQNRATILIADELTRLETAYWVQKLHATSVFLFAFSLSAEAHSQPAAHRESQQRSLRFRRA